MRKALTKEPTVTGIIPIKRALVSVHDKSGLDTLAAFFKAEQILVLSTGGTASYLRSLGLTITDSAAVGQTREMLDGRVKTLTPRIYGGILFDRGKETHWATILEQDIPPIDLVVANFYPFQALGQDASIDELIENIDIGGPSMVRASAKNYRYVTAIHDPRQYAQFIAHYQEYGGTSLAFRESYAKSVFAFTSQYDQTIALRMANKFDKTEAKTQDGAIHLASEKQLRYGENPHQKALVYSSTYNAGEIDLASVTSLMGKELSYNNLLDTHAAIWSLRCLSDHQEHHQHYAVVVKHGVPCGAACAPTAHEAIKKALLSDELSAFGGIVAFSGNFDAACAQAFGNGFFEVIIARSFTKEAIDLLSKRKNLRLLPIQNIMSGHLDQKSYRSILGGVLVQEHDTTTISPQSWHIVTHAKPSTTDLKAMEFAFRLVKATPSNAITVALPDQLLGVGAGQPNRIKSTELAIFGATSRGFDVSRAALASDAFFPFSDCIELAHSQGIRLIIQPGGSIHDQEIIDKANRWGLSMVFTHQRHFRH
jgi:phosphoribosylaminoimidazolecarboxamide formyltransferase / IMP cyclohydrolase